MRFFQSVLFLFVFSLSGLSFSVAQTQSRLDEIIARGVLKVGTPGDYSPFSFKDPKTGELTGLDIDQAKSLSKALGVRLEIVETSWPTLTQDFQDDKFDIAMGGISITLERQKIGLFSHPYLEDGKTPIARCADKDKFKSIAEIDQPGVKVIANPGGTNSIFVHDNIKQAQIITWKDNKSIFDALAAGEGDVMITDGAETHYQQKLRPGILCAVNVDKPFSHIDKAYWIQRDPYWAAFVNQWIDLSQKNDTFAAIRDKWIN
jgi:cyclohexadienyl dehydratase